MSTSEAQKKASRKYNQANYKQVNLLLRPPDYEQVKSIAAACNESVNGFIKVAITERIARIKQELNKLEKLDIDIQGPGI